MALDWSTEGCTIEGTAEVIGDRWSLLILREVISGIRRFDQLTVRTGSRGRSSPAGSSACSSRASCAARPTRSPGSGSGTSTG